MTEVAWLTACDAGALIRSKVLSPVEYVEGLINHIGMYDPSYHAFLSFTPELAIEDARRTASEVANGIDLGPLHGVPYALKDMIDYAGIPTTAHSKILAGHRATSDATVTEKLRAAGAVFMGKLSCHSFAIGNSNDLPWPPALNPWNTGYFAGGSSSGSGAAVAAGFVPVSIGTDTGGSVRSPASMCGVVGMKPTYGLVSRRGVFPLSFSLDHVGPISRTVEDNALVLNAISGYDPRDPTSVEATGDSCTKDLGRDLAGMKIGAIRHFYMRDMKAHSDVVEVTERAVDRLQQLGAEVVDLEMAPLLEYSAHTRAILLSEAFSVHQKWLQERPQDYGAATRERLLSGAFVRAVDYVDATRTRRRLQEQFAQLMRPLDAAVTVGSMDPPCRADDLVALEGMYHRQARMPFNLLGNPAISVPAGFSQEGLPIGIQIAGKPFDESTVYRIAYAYEESETWAQRRPQLTA